MSNYLGPSKFAVDDELVTAACTKMFNKPWWAVDLKKAINVGSVMITSLKQGDGQLSIYCRSSFIEYYGTYKPRHDIVVQNTAHFGTEAVRLRPEVTTFVVSLFTYEVVHSSMLNSGFPINRRV